MANRPPPKKSRPAEPLPVQPPPIPGLSGTHIAIMHGFDTTRKIIESFGPAGGFLAVFGLFSWTFGSKNSRDELFRMVIFGTKGWAWPIAMGMLATCAVLWGYLKIRRAVADSNEKKRNIAERNRLQEKIIGKPLHHTDGERDGDANDATDALAE